MNFTKSVAAATLISMSASIVMAGNPDAAAQSPALATPAAVDWTGVRAGLQVSKQTGRVEYLVNDVLFNGADLDNDTTFGGFIGYDKQIGNYVIGLEASLSKVDTVPVGFPATHLNDVKSVKARFGLAKDKTLFYGVAGISSSSFFDAGPVYDQKGTVLGLGIEHMVTQKVFVGAEFNVHKMDDELSATEDFETRVNTVSLRTGIRF